MNGLERLCTELVSAGAPGALAFAAGPEGAFGAAAGTDVESGRPLRVGQGFRAGSVTKTAVAALVLLLAEDGRLGLDDPADRWVARRPGSRSDSCSSTRADCRTTRRTRRSANATFATPRLSGTPRSCSSSQGRTTAGAGSFAYSNTNYVVLGLVIEAVGGAALGDQLARRVLEPLALQESHLAPGGGAAAGGLVSTAADVARLLRALLQGELLEPASLEEMLDTVPGDGGEFARYGLGIAEMDSFLGIVPSPCGSAWGHLGLMPGCTCAALSTRDGARQAVLMTSGPINEAFGERMWDLFCG